MQSDPDFSQFGHSLFPLNARRSLVRLHLFPGQAQIRTVKHLAEQRVRIDWSPSILPKNAVLPRTIA